MHTCRLLYAAYRMLPRSRSLQGLDEQRRKQRGVGIEFKREARHGRRFSCNELHCRIRGLGFVNLDRQGTGISMVRLSEKLGEGGFATVYQGNFELDDDGNGRICIGDPVAVKMFSNDKSDSAKFNSRLWQSMEHMTQHHEQSMTHNCGIIEEDRFSSELRRLVSVRHPNIVTPRGYIGKRSQGESGLVMELMDESLHDYLEKVNRGDVPPLQELDMLDLMLEIAKGMRFLHECNLIHRDLKPKNVLLRFYRDSKHRACQVSEVKLADFGLTKLCDFAQADFAQAGGSTIYRQTSFQGTSCYVAPELRGHACLQESPDQIEKVDVFSYGTTCFNILVGNPDALAFSSQSVKVFYEAMKTGEWKQWVQGIDEKRRYMVKLIARCWESEPARRPTFATLCVLLQHALQCLLLSYQSRGSIFVAASGARELHTFQKDFKLRYSHVYKSIIMNLLQEAVGGVRVIMKCFLDFESANPPPIHRNRFLQMAPIEVARRILSGIIRNKGNVSDGVETSDFAQDVLIFREAMRKGHFKHEEIESFMYLCEFMDPLLFIKGIACHNSACMYDSKKMEPESMVSIYQKYEFDFKSDEAFCDLEVDKSLIPLLVTFWSIF